MIALQRILLTILLVSSAGSQAAIAQKLQLTKSSAWNAAYEAMCPVDGNELARFRVDPSLLVVLDLALSQSDAMRSERPLVRVIYQRAARYAFDSLATAADRLEGGNQAVRLRLARIIALCALTDDEITALKNTYTGTAIGDDRKRNPAFDIDLPSDLFDKDGEWLQLTYDKLQRIALTHEKSRNGRNEFLLFVRFPGGREEAEAYLNDHNAHAAASGRWRQEILDFRVPRGGDIPDSPQFPRGSRAILVERMLVVNREGIPVSTPIVTSLAIIESKPTVNGNNGRLHRVRSAAFEVDVHALLDIDQNPSLRRLGDSEPFSGVHRFPNGNQMCITCHSGHGLLSLNGGVAAMVFPDLRTVTIVSNGNASATARWKEQEPGYALLRGILEGMQWRDATDRGRTRP